MKRLAHDRFDAQRPKVEPARAPGAEGPLSALAAAWRAAEPDGDASVTVRVKAPTPLGVPGNRTGGGPSGVR